MDILSGRMGPRVIDVDILFYGDDVVHINKVEGLDDLVIPHQRICERGFVLKPMCDIAPDFIHPVTKKSIREMLKSINSSDCIRVFPLADGNQLYLDERTLVMGILNVTPDSFSDGGSYIHVDVGVVIISKTSSFNSHSLSSLFKDWWNDVVESSRSSEAND